ncbi:MAG: AMP-binding protein [Bacilli bacterium]|nr:AMP-binding protein [Bacilli bacterium]
METSIKKEGNQLSVSIAGAIDSFSYFDLLVLLNKEVDENTDVLLDFRDVEYVASAGFKTLISVQKRAKSLKIINAKDFVYDSFVATGFDTLFDVSLMKEDVFTYYNAAFKYILETKARYFPDRVFLKDSRGAYTWSDIEKCAQIIAGDLRKKGVRKGSHVAIYSANSINWVLTFFALQKMGAIACLLNSAYNVSELKTVSKVGDISLICYGDSTAKATNANFVDEIVNVEDSAFVDSYDISSNINFKDRLNEYESLDGMFECFVGADDVCVMIYTSGSTGTPKGVLLSAFNILNSSLSMSVGTKMNEKDKLCLILPLFHIFGMTAGLFCNLDVNSSIYIPDNIKTSTLLKAIDEEKCTLFHSVPTMMLALMNNPDFTTEKVSSLRCSILAGAPATKAQLAQMKEKFPNDTFVVAYGLSEMAPISLTEYENNFDRLSQTVGKPVSYIGIRIQDLSTGEECKVGEQGEILAGGYSCFSGYYKVPLEKQAIDNVGWIHTGDLGFLDEDGYLHLTGRAKEIIIRGGENLVPNEIAGEISKHKSVADVKVVGVPDDFFGEVVCACLVLRGGETFNKDEMNAFLSDKLAKYKIPAYYVVYDAFPMLASGKVDAVSLRKDAIIKCQEAKKSGK